MPEITCIELLLPHKIKCVYTGADSEGLEYKTKIMEDIIQRDSPFSKIDFGTQYPGDKGLHYFDTVARFTDCDQEGVGITFSGHGTAMIATAVRYDNLRVAYCLTPETAEDSRIIHNANILTIPVKLIDLETAKEIVHRWLKTPYIPL